MKVDELISCLEECTRYKQNEVPSVHILIKKPYGTVGAQPTVELKHVYSGFDWDAGKILLEPAEPLQQIDAVLSAQLAATVKKYDNLYYENQHIKAENRRLKKELNDIKAKQSTK
jgi:hypothetical protein